MPTDRVGSINAGGVRFPPLEPVRSIVAAFESRGVPVAVGGSAVLASLGLVDVVRDWDVTVDCDVDAAIDVLRDLGIEPEDRTESTPPFATASRLVISAPDHALDVLVRFALMEDGERWLVPVRVHGYWQGLPVAHPGDWERAYRLMGRVDRAALLTRHPDASAWMDQ